MEVYCLGVGATALDLSYQLDENTIMWPGGEGFKLCMMTSGDGESGSFYAAGKFSCAEHGGTHVDAPYHFDEKGKTIEMLDLKDLIGSCRVISIAERIGDDADGCCLPCDIENHEAIHGTIEHDSIVFIHTGWCSRWDQGPQAYLGLVEEFSSSTSLSFTGISLAAATLLLDRGVKAVGIDTASIDNGSSTSFDTHRLILGSGLYAIENLNSQIKLLPPRGSTVIVLPLKLTGGSGAPTRVLVLIPKS